VAASSIQDGLLRFMNKCITTIFTIFSKDIANLRRIPKDADFIDNTNLMYGRQKDNK